METTIALNNSAIFNKEHFYKLITDSAGGDNADKFMSYGLNGLLNSTNGIYYSKNVKSHHNDGTKRFTDKNGNPINGILSLVEHYRRDYGVVDTPVFIVPLTKEIHEYLCEFAQSYGVSVRSEMLEDDNVVIRKDGDGTGTVVITYTSDIEKLYDTTIRHKYNMLFEGAREVIIVRS